MFVCYHMLVIPSGQKPPDRSFLSPCVLIHLLPKLQVYSLNLSSSPTPSHSQPQGCSWQQSSLTANNNTRIPRFHLNISIFFYFILPLQLILSSNTVILMLFLNKTVSWYIIGSKKHYLIHLAGHILLAPALKESQWFNLTLVR